MDRDVSLDVREPRVEVGENRGAVVGTVEIEQIDRPVRRCGRRS
jgi:hypothetical protein